MLVECVVVEPNTYLGTMYVIVVIERLSHEAVALIFFLLSTIAKAINVAVP